MFAPCNLEGEQLWGTHYKWNKASRLDCFTVSLHITNGRQRDCDWPLKNCRNSHQSHKPIIHCNSFSPVPMSPYLSKQSANHTINDSGTYATDSPTADLLGLCSSLGWKTAWGINLHWKLVLKQDHWCAVMTPEKLEFHQHLRSSAILKTGYTHNWHPIARPWGRDMGCLLRVWSLIYVLPDPLHCWFTVIYIGLLGSEFIWCKWQEQHVERGHQHDMSYGENGANYW